MTNKQKKVLMFVGVMSLFVADSCEGDQIQGQQ